MWSCSRKHPQYRNSALTPNCNIHRRTYNHFPWNSERITDSCTLIDDDESDLLGLAKHLPLHVIFDLNTINKNNLNSVKVDIKLNKGGKRQLEDMGETDNFKKFKTVAKN